MRETFNPWIEIWVRPRSTIRRVVNENPNRSLWWLAAIYGFGSLMNNAQSMALGHVLNLFGIFLIAIVFSAIWGYITFSIWSAVVHWIGKLFKGEGTFQTVRAAYSWSCVPLAINIPLWILLAAVFGQRLFMVSGENINDRLVFLLFFILIVRLILAIWSLVIYFNALAEVQNFSVLKAILNVVIAGALLMAAVWVLWTICTHIIHPGSQVMKAGSMFWSEGFSLLQSGNIYK